MCSYYRRLCSIFTVKVLSNSIVTNTMYLNRRNNSAESNLAEVQEELEQVDEECFSWATAKLALGHITLEDYFDRLIDHIREGEARHTWDKSNSNIAHTLQGDLIAGAFKSRMLKRNLGKISHAGKMTVV